MTNPMNQTEIQQQAGLTINFSGASPDNTTQAFIKCADATEAKMQVWSDGDLANADGTYGSLSDIKTKDESTIVAARSYWDDFKSLQYKKYKHKTDVADHGSDAQFRIGLIAQEVESVFPACVPESPDSEDLEVAVPAIMGEDGSELAPATTRIESGFSETETHKWVKSSIIEGPIMARVVQELQARVEALESA